MCPLPRCAIKLVFMAHHYELLVCKAIRSVLPYVIPCFYFLRKSLFGVLSVAKLSESSQNQNQDRRFIIVTCGLIFRKTISKEGLGWLLIGGRDFLSSVGDPAWSSLGAREGGVGRGSGSQSFSSGTDCNRLCATVFAYS